MDALFGLPRKKMAGVSYREPLHGDLLFCDQSQVDQFVADSETSKRSQSSKREPDVSNMHTIILCVHAYTII